jgi:hypothetical protein
MFAINTCIYLIVIGLAPTTLLRNLYSVKLPVENNKGMEK